MKKSTWIVIGCVALALVAIVIAMLFVIGGNTNNDVETISTQPEGYPSDILYKDSYIPFPFTLEEFIKDGWYFYTNNPKGYIVLSNDRYPGVVLTICDDHYVNCNLEAIEDEVYGLSFNMDNDCDVYPDVVVKDAIRFKSTRQDVENVLGAPYEEDGYYINGLSYEFLSFESRYDGYILDYNITLANDSVKSITVVINR